MDSRQEICVDSKRTKNTSYTETKDKESIDDPDDGYEIDYGSCHLCRTSYDEQDPERLPKLLICAHTFCFACLAKLATNGQIRCPKGCAAITKLHKSGLDGLMSNQALIAVLPQLSELNTRLPLCENCDKKQVLKRCAECNASLCNTCAIELHSSKVQRRHTITSLHGRSGSKLEFKCLEHKDHPLDLYCYTDKVPVCIMCRDYGCHGGHEIQDIYDVHESDKEKMERQMKSISEHLQKLETLSRKVADAEKNIATSQFNVNSKIDGFSKSLINIIENKTKLLLSQLQTLKRHKSSKLYSRRQEVAVLVSTFSVLKEEAKLILNSANAVEFMGHQVAFMEKFDDAISKLQNFDCSVPMEDTIISLDVDETLLEKLRNFARLSTTPEAPRLNSETTSTKTSIHVSWIPCLKTSHVLQYAVEIAHCPGANIADEDLKFTQIRLCAVNIIQVIIDNLKPSSVYAIRIRACNSAGWGPYSIVRKLFTAVASGGIDSLKKELEHKKFTAVRLNRAGHHQRAAQELKSAKQLQTEIQNCEDELRLKEWLGDK